MPYEIRVVPSVARALKKLSLDVVRPIRAAMGDLRDDPHPAGAESVKDARHCYRIRVGDYRIVYAVFSDEREILVLRVGSRDEVYKGIVGDLNRLVAEHRRAHGSE